MKNVLSEIKAKEYFCRLSIVQAKKTLFGMSLVKGDQNMRDSAVYEVRYIAGLYDGIIQSKFAKDLAGRLAEAYNAEHPGAILTKKSAQQYTEFNHGKILEAFGLYGFDYVLTVVRHAKACMSEPNSELDEKGVLCALRWEERRDTYDVESSNLYHRKKGLMLLGFEELTPVLLNYSCYIANVYELVTPVKVADSCDDNQEKEQKATARQMKVHFIEQAELIEQFYATEKPVTPAGYDESQLEEGSVVFNLAANGMLKDSEAILAYQKQREAYQKLVTRIDKEFSEQEKAIIEEKAEAVKELIKDSL